MCVSVCIQIMQICNFDQSQTIPTHVYVSIIRMDLFVKFWQVLFFTHTACRCVCLPLKLKSHPKIRYDADDEFHWIFFDELHICFIRALTHIAPPLCALWHLTYSLICWIFFFSNEYNEIWVINIQNIGHFVKIVQISNTFYLTFDLKFIIVSSSATILIISKLEVIFKIYNFLFWFLH